MRIDVADQVTAAVEVEHDGKVFRRGADRLVKPQADRSTFEMPDMILHDDVVRPRRHGLQREAVHDGANIRGFALLHGRVEIAHSREERRDLRMQVDRFMRVGRILGRHGSPSLLFRASRARIPDR